MNKPLAEVLRPRQLEQIVGHQSLTGPSGIITILVTKAAASGFFPSLILWGPPGCGKTTLARAIAHQLEREFYEFSAVNASVKDIEKILPPPGNRLPVPPPVVFIDEIHRFNKAQQDALLPHVEKADIVLLGATTENPSFSVIHALMSRCRTITLHHLSPEALHEVLLRGLEIIGKNIHPQATTFLLETAHGDARTLLNTLEIASHLASEKELQVTDLEAAMQDHAPAFDKGGEEFYNTISALHKSVRGSDPNAALYWLARMLEAGQDPLYIARRIIRMASEDIGLEDPQALLIANAAYDTCQKIGVPECSLALAEAVVYLSHAPKSNSLYTAYSQAAQDAHQFGNLPVPLHIRNGVTPFMRAEGYGKDYDYSHSPTGTKKENVMYLPDQLKDRQYLSKLSS